MVHYRVAPELLHRFSAKQLAYNYFRITVGGLYSRCEYRREAGDCTYKIGSPETDHHVIEYSFFSHYPLLRRSRCARLVSGV